jgi:hypothetical protein
MSFKPFPSLRLWSSWHMFLPPTRLVHSIA